MPEVPLIAIIDDEEDVSVALCGLLRALGFRAEVFTRAQHCLDRSNFARFSCIISDIHMPTMNGLEFTRKLSNLAPGLPVILMTGRMEPDLESQAYASGAIAILVKPFGIDVLSESLQKALATRS